jgi:tetratricopeptide (TPR) repeat protein
MEQLAENMIDVPGLREAGLAALQSGDAAAAKRHLLQLADSGHATASTWGALAMACRDLGDMPAMISSVEKALELDQANLPALILKGDYLFASGNARAATAFYGLAVELARHMPTIAPSLGRMIRHAESARDRINADIERHLRSCLGRDGYDSSHSSARFTHALDILTGDHARYTQKRKFVAALMRAIDSYAGSTRSAWND